MQHAEGKQPVLHKQHEAENGNDAGRGSAALACKHDAWCADLVVEVVEDDWSHDQSNTLSNQLHQTHMRWVRHTCWIRLDYQSSW